jgi:hypothetical protein
MSLKEKIFLVILLVLALVLAWTTPIHAQQPQSSLEQLRDRMWEVCDEGFNVDDPKYDECKQVLIKIQAEERKERNESSRVNSKASKFQ